MDYIDYVALMIAYNKGLDNLIGDLRKTLLQINGGEALGYVRKAKAALQMNFSYQSQT
jgi:hypothetical protein